MTLERKSCDMEKATFHGHVNQVGSCTLFNTKTSVTLELDIIWASRISDQVRLKPVCSAIEKS